MEDRRDYQEYWQNLERRSPVIKYQETAEYQEFLRIQLDRKKRDEKLKEVLATMEALKINIEEIVKEDEESRKREKEASIQLAKRLAESQTQQYVANTIVKKESGDNGVER